MVLKKKQFLFYNIKGNKWTTPEVFGDAPPDTCQHTATLINNDQLIVFGGAGNKAVKYLEL